MRSYIKHLCLSGFLHLLFCLCCLYAVDARAQFYDPKDSLFTNKFSDSYSSYKNEEGKKVDPFWGSLKPDDFGPLNVNFDYTGLRSVNQIPLAGVHPRILFTADDLPEIRKRLKETRAGQRAWNNILCYTEMLKGVYDDQSAYALPDRFNGLFGGLHGPVPLFRMGIPRTKDAPYTRNPNALAMWESLIDGSATDFPQFYWDVYSLEAFRCLIENDKEGAEKLAKAISTSLRLDQAWRTKNREEKKLIKPYAEPLRDDNSHRGYQFAYCYDFLFNWLNAEQKSAWHQELAESTWSHDNYGTFNTAESSRSNWASFSYWLLEVLAIEGEAGFNDLKVRGIYRGWRNLFTYGWFQSGATFEGEAKNQLGMDGVIMFAMREKAWGFQNLAGHPYLRAYATRFLPHSVNAMHNGFQKYDLLGGSRSKGTGFTVCDSIGLKYLFPKDKIIDWTYRMAIGEDYENVPERPDGYYNALLFFAIFASDFDPANNDLSILGLGNTFFCPHRALMMTRSSWSKGAVQLNLHTRQANGGHAFADRNAIMVAGAGRIWSPNNYASFKTQENSVVSIDNVTQSLNTPGRMVDFKSVPLADFAVGDASYCWNWNWHELDPKRGLYTLADARDARVELPPNMEPEKRSINSFSMSKLPLSNYNVPKFEAPHWLMPMGSIRPVAKQTNYPVKKAYRTAGLVRGNHPYMVVLDDIQKDYTSHRYDWVLTLEYDIQIVKMTTQKDGILDIYLTGSDPNQKEILTKSRDALPTFWSSDKAIPDGQPMLLIRVLQRRTEEAKDDVPFIDELPNMTNPKKYGPVRRLVIPARSISPEFKVMLYPYVSGVSTLPRSEWSRDGKTVTVEWDKQRDALTFTPSLTGKTDLSITRGSQQILRVDAPAATLD